MFSKWPWLILACCLGGGAAVADVGDESTLGSPSGAIAQSAGKTDPPAKSPPAAQAVPAAALPDEIKLNMLIRTTIIAVNQANKTGNYTVLRDLGSPRFKSANSAEGLASIFEALRKSKFDLSPILFFTPKLLRPAALENGMLRLTGFFDTRPQRVAFDFLFEDVKGDWQLFGINIATQAAPAVSGQSVAPAPKAEPPEKK